VQIQVQVLLQLLMVFIINSITRATSNYSAYFAQNVGIGTDAPTNLLHLSKAQP